MADYTSTTSTSPLSRHIAPAVIVTFFALVMSSCVLGVVIWKAFEAKTATLAHGQTSTQNLVHSLAEHAAHAIQAADISMGGVVELLKYQTPEPERVNRYLKEVVEALPQIREIGVLDADGNWQYSSLPQTPQHNNADRDYFIYHRGTPGTALRISHPLQSRTTGLPTIVLTKRINTQDGGFNGVLIAAIDNDYFNAFYSRFQLGNGGGISLLLNDGIVEMRWPLSSIGTDLSKTQLFATQLKLSSAGYYKIISPFDGMVKYFGYEETPSYSLILTVARSESELLSSWYSSLKIDALVGSVLLCMIVLSATLIWWQFHFRMKIERTLRDREARYRLLADNIADVVILFDNHGTVLYVSQSVEPVLGIRSGDLIGKSYFKLIHPDDRERAMAATDMLQGPDLADTIVFRSVRPDGSIVWVESNFKLTSERDDQGKTEFVGVLRDVTERKMMEDELTSLNGRLAQLATTDGLTGLSNRRTFDSFLRREFEEKYDISVLLFDIDDFKGYNDKYGHQVGDECLKAVAKVIANATENTPGMSARYGGEEFVIVLPDVTEANAIKVAEAVRLTVRALGIPNSASSRGYVTISAGVAVKSNGAPDEMALIGEADLALYEAKRLGRNRVLSHRSLTTIESVPLQYSLESDDDLFTSPAELRT